ncbi:hypothetical protein [Candidatus Laterigemmans baculatus]|uniref:hypothetical protein n=1 Tax=Candidatus Laterigemmans baculatus TaxID=2770505 RepID=UPI0013D98F8C|nr:hypothetical protein [Candidatus Laterigemmans baculatus]
MIREIAAQPAPQWLASVGEPLPELPVRDVLAGSVYYPASGFDGDPVKFLGGNFHSFVYVDYGIGREQLLENLEAFRGYRVASYREVTERELTPNGWNPIPPQAGEGSSRMPDGRIKPPFGVWSIHKRTEEYGPEHGPERFSLIYIGGDGVATFQALYHGNRVAPAVLAIIQPGTGFGGNWTDFEDPDAVLARSVLGNESGVPEYLLYGGGGDGAFYRKPCWPSYSELVGVIHGRLRLWKRSGD